MQSENLDDLVQRLAVARYALDAGDPDAASEAIDGALALARQLLSADAHDTLLRTRASD